VDKCRLAVLFQLQWMLCRQDILMETWCFIRKHKKQNRCVFFFYWFRLYLDPSYFIVFSTFNFVRFLLYIMVKFKLENQMSGWCAFIDYCVELMSPVTMNIQSFTYLNSFWYFSYCCLLHVTSTIIKTWIYLLFTLIKILRVSL